jgi:Secretion system C-terminal sorting domain
VYGSYNGAAMIGSQFNASSLGAGTYTASYVYTDANSCANAAEATIIVTECTGIINTSNISTSISIYPNPAKDILVVSSGAAASKVSIHDALGRTLIVQNLNSVEEKINLSDIPSGIYLISIQTDYGKLIKTIKFVKE